MCSCHGTGFFGSEGAPQFIRPDPGHRDTLRKLLVGRKIPETLVTFFEGIEITASMIDRNAFSSPPSSLLFRAYCDASKTPLK